MNGGPAGKGGERVQYSISEREFLFFSQMIYRINTLNDYESVARTTLEQLKLLIPFTKGIVYQMRQEGQRLVYTYPVALDPPGQQYDEEAILRDHAHPDWLLYTSAPWSSTFRQTDIRDEETFLNSELYRRIYQPQNTYYGLHTVLIHEDCKLAQLGLFRPRDAQDFSDREVFLLEAVSVHLEWKLYTFLSGAQRRSALPEEELRRSVGRRFGLTRRELEVLALVDRGKSNEEITAQLFISKSTLDKHLYHIYRKTGVKNRMQLMHLSGQSRMDSGTTDRGSAGRDRD